MGLPWWYSGKESAFQCRRCRFDPWVRKIPWRKKWQPTPIFLPGRSHGQRSQAGYIVHGATKELDWTEWLNNKQNTSGFKKIRALPEFQLRSGNTVIHTQIPGLKLVLFLVSDASDPQKAFSEYLLNDWTKKFICFRLLSFYFHKTVKVILN